MAHGYLEHMLQSIVSSEKLAQVSGKLSQFLVTQYCKMQILELRHTSNFHVLHEKHAILQMKGSVEKGDNCFWWLQKVKGQQNIFVVKQAIMAEIQQFNLCTVEIQPCYLPRH